MAQIRMSPLVPFGVLFLILLSYSNCSSSKMSYDENPQLSSSSTTSLKDVCSQSELDVFSLGYHQFLRTNCTSCHFSGPGKGTFAHPDSNIAFSSFQSLGLNKISAMAVSDTHNFPYTGGHNIEQINNLKTQWNTYQIEKAKCQATPSPTGTSTKSSFTPAFMTIKKTIPTIVGTPSTTTVNGTQMNVISYNTTNLSFNLSQELSTLSDKSIPDTDGATLSVSISGYSNPSGATGYLIQMPRLKTNNLSVRLSGLHVVINGRPVGFTYTFQHVDSSVYKMSEVMLSGGSMLVLGPISEGDQIALSIGNIEVVELSPPLASPSVQFSLSSVNLLETQFGYGTPYKVAVSLQGDNSMPVSVSLEPTGDEKLSTTAKGLIEPSGRNRFNWDYRFQSSTSITFLPGEKVKYVDIIFSDDLRDDVTKTLSLTLKDPFGCTIGTQSTLVITIPDYNPSTSGSVTFSQLMSPGGILEMNCVRCHNSVNREGGYDMTDYQEMVVKGVIKPGDIKPNSHKMYRRMNPDAPEAGLITPMPLDGFLTQDLTLVVEDWIKAGAKNN